MPTDQTTFKRLKNIAANFKIDGEIIGIEPISGGLINSTYKVVTQNGSPDYILQKKNSVIFKDIPAMMENIVKVSTHLKSKIIETGGKPDIEAMTVILTDTGKPYFRDENGDFWTLSTFIPDTIQFEDQITPSLAFKGGEGIGKFHKQMADFNESLGETLPGFHDLGYRFKQWDEAVDANLAGKAGEVRQEIKWVEKRRARMSCFWKLIEDSLLPKRVVHNDTKISNLLFNRNEELLCVIDLDTVMNNTPLADFGDAIRSFANTGKEDDPVLENIGIDLDIFSAYAEGYLSQMKNTLTDLEKDYLAFGALYITYEQVIRFLMDYLDGDKYYNISYPGHNLVRTRAQMKLFESMEENYDKMNQIIKSLL